MTVRACVRVAGLQVALILLAFGSSAQDGRGPVLKDQFLGVEPFGAVAMVHDKVTSINQATRIQVLDRGAVTAFARRANCVGVISHHDPSTKASSFFGLQIVSMFRAGTMSTAVYVKRNGGWVSRVDGKSLTSMPAARQVRASVSEFGEKHGTLTALKDLTFGDGKPIMDQWHASLTADELGNPSVDSANDENRPFWNAPPWSDDAFKEALKPFAEGSVVRLDNHLFSFQVTDGRNVHTAVPFTFPCSDINLTAVALRIFAPLKSEAFWYVLKMKNEGQPS